MFGKLFCKVCVCRSVSAQVVIAVLFACVARADFSLWSSYADMVFDGYAGAETLANFPALIKLTVDAPSGFDYANLKPDGSDLRFVLLPDETELAYEIEVWNPDGESFVWVSIPALTSTTAIRMYFGNAVATFSELHGAAFPTEFGYVWHMNAPVITNAVAAYPYTIASANLDPVVTNAAPTGAALKFFADMNRG